MKPIEDKVEAIFYFQLYYQRINVTFWAVNVLSGMAAPITNLFSRMSKFIWAEKCQESFDKIKDILQNSPVLSAPELKTNNSLKQLGLCSIIISRQ